MQVKLHIVDAATRYLLEVGACSDPGSVSEVLDRRHKLALPTSATLPKERKINK
jgi:hypothetical protein